MNLPAAIERLREHPDASANLGPDSAGRSNGFQHLAAFADGSLKVWFHWGSRAFASWSELEGWLLMNQAPASWRDR